MPETANNLEQFQEFLKKGSQKAVADFWAEWCGPCRAIAPVFNALSNDNPDLTFIKIDVDNAPDISEAYGIRSMPTFITFYQGEEIGRVIGANPRSLQVAVAELNIK